jgi:ParB/RepB/Spo0J family partition protein
MTVETKTKLIKINMIEPNPWNPNKVPDEIMRALVANITEHGVLQSVTVREVEEPGLGGETMPGSGKYEIIDGEHRFAAAQEAGHTQVWGTISEMTKEQAKAQTLAMNRLRGEMDPAGVAQVFKDLADFGTPIDELARLTGYSEQEITAGIALLDFEWPEAPEVEPGEEEWVTFTCRMPVEVWEIVKAELDRLKQATGGEHDFRALEVMAVTSSQTPLASFE